MNRNFVEVIASFSKILLAISPLLSCQKQLVKGSDAVANGESEYDRNRTNSLIINLSSMSLTNGAVVTNGRLKDPNGTMTIFLSGNLDDKGIFLNPSNTTDFRIRLVNKTDDRVLIEVFLGVQRCGFDFHKYLFSVSKNSIRKIDYSQLCFDELISYDVNYISVGNGVIYKVISRGGPSSNNVFTKDVETNLIHE